MTDPCIRSSPTRSVQKSGCRDPSGSKRSAQYPRSGSSAARAVHRRERGELAAGVGPERARGSLSSESAPYAAEEHERGGEHAADEPGAPRWRGGAGDGSGAAATAGHGSLRVRRTKQAGDRRRLAVLGRLRQEARRRRRLVHVLDQEPALGHHVDVSAQRAVHEGQSDAGRHLLDGHVVGQVGPDPPVLLVEDVVVDPAAARGLEQRVVQEAARSGRRARGPGRSRRSPARTGRGARAQADDDRVERRRPRTAAPSAVPRTYADRPPRSRAPRRSGPRSGRRPRPRRRAPAIASGELALAAADVEHPRRAGEVLVDEREDLLLVLGVGAVGEVLAATTPRGVSHATLGPWTRPALDGWALSRGRGAARGTRPVWLSGGLGDVLGRALDDDPAAAVAALGPEVDDPVGRLDHVEVVLDHEHGVAGVDEPLQHAEQPAHVLEVQAGGRLVEDVDRAAGGALAELGRRASPAAPRRPTAWARAGRAARSRARRRPASAGAGRSSAGWRRTRAPPRSTGRARRRCSCP